MQHALLLSKCFAIGKGFLLVASYLILLGVEEGLFPYFRDLEPEPQRCELTCPASDK